MNKSKINQASKALLNLELAQQKFNEIIDALSDEEVQEWAKQNDVTIQPSKSKERVAALLTQKPTKGAKE